MAWIKPNVKTLKTDVASAIEDCVSELDSIQTELQDWLDGLPENLQTSSKAEQLQEAIDTLSNIQSPEVSEKFEHIDLIYTIDVNAKSRSKRRDNICTILHGARQALDELTDDEEAQALSEQLEEIIDYAESVEFPGMYG